MSEVHNIDKYVPKMSKQFINKQEKYRCFSSADQKNCFFLELLRENIPLVVLFPIVVSWSALLKRKLLLCL